MELKEKAVLEIVRKVKKIYYRKPLTGKYNVIIDFYNIYCSMIKFNRYRTFSRRTWELVIKNILSCNKADKVFIVSKPIFEINNLDIYNMSNKYPRLNYIVVEDMNSIRSLNKERDDYICIFLQYIFNKENINSIIVTNDKFSNYNKIINNIKHFNIRIYNINSVKLISFTPKIINSMKKRLLNDEKNIKNKRTEFYY